MVSVASTLRGRPAGPNNKRRLDKGRRELREIVRPGAAARHQSLGRRGRNRGAMCIIDADTAASEVHCWYPKRAIGPHELGSDA